MSQSLPAYLHRMLSARCPQALPWLEEQAGLIASQDPLAAKTDLRAAQIALARAPRYSGKAALDVKKEEAETLDQLVPGFTVHHWTCDQLARLWLLLQVPADRPERLLRALHLLLRSADLAEAVALYQALPCLPHAPHLLARAREGLRSNQLPICAAVALDSPFPCNYFDEAAWNQMILKCLFVGLPLRRIQGLDQRRNRALALMLDDYARERRAAKRSISHELWRLSLPCLSSQRLGGLKALLQDIEQDDPRAPAYAALGLRLNPLAEAQELLEELPLLQQALAGLDPLDWQEIERRQICT